MIFITLGSQKFQFDRLLRAVDDLIEQGKITDEVFAQRGYSGYVPQYFSFKDFLSREEFKATMKKADLVLSHGGTGAIIGAVKQGKKVIAVPRLARYGEHVDDHQIQLLEQFENMDIIEVCYELDKLGETIEKTRKRTYQSYTSNTDKIINSIEAFISERGENDEKKAY